MLLLPDPISVLTMLILVTTRSLDFGAFIESLVMHTHPKFAEHWSTSGRRDSDLAQYFRKNSNESRNSFIPERAYPPA